VDFDLDADEEALAAAVRQLCEGRFSMEVLRTIEEEGCLDRARWAELAEAGVFSLRLAEASGGAGLRMAHAVLVFEELGRGQVPGPLVATHLAAGLVEGAAGGTRVVGSVERPDPDGVAVVEHLADLDDLVVSDEDGLWLVEPSDLEAAPLRRPLDPLSPVHRVAALPRGRRLGGAAEAGVWRRRGAALTAALLVGIARAETEAGVAYAKVRQQFDRPVGSFQAVKHILADMLVRAEVARAAVHAAGVTLDDPEVGDPARAVAGAKLMAGDAAVANGKACVQVHGGMGFTWEVDVHLFLKRARVLDTHFGSVDHQAEELAGMLTR
jgi:alkylation response protein AidB-like acyl-CoA dehydrogenase